MPSLARKLRIKRGNQTQRQFALDLRARFALPVSEQMIHRWEHAKTKPQRRYQSMLAQLLGTAALAQTAETEKQP